jgi:hypothetical protein
MHFLFLLTLGYLVGLAIQCFLVCLAFLEPQRQLIESLDYLVILVDRLIPAFLGHLLPYSEILVYLVAPEPQLILAILVVQALLNLIQLLPVSLEYLYFPEYLEYPADLDFQ